MTCGEQADCLRALAAAESAHLAATASVLGAFSASGGFADDGQATARAWLRWQTRITSAAAGGTTAWSRRLAAHPQIAAALAAGVLSPSYARAVCDWTDSLPAENRRDADRILLEAAGSGVELADLAALAEEIHRRCARPDGDGGDDAFARRWLRLTEHYRGHAKLDGDLTPQAAAALRAMLDALGAKAGPEDDRTQPQRDHDALEEACRQLIAGGLPDRAGQPTQIQLVMTLEQLLGLAGAADAATASGLALAPPGAECDASIAPIVMGHVDEEVLGQIAARLPPAADDTSAAGGTEAACDTTRAASAKSAALASRAARQLTVAEATRLLSGPAGLASWLRTSKLTGPAAAISLPLDVGAVTETIPAHLRRAIVRRDRRCRFPGCHRRPAACHVHHLVPRSEGGTTCLENCGLFCTFHHLIAIHRWGWTVSLNPDGTTTAVSPDGRRTFHSHAPPTAA